MRRTISSFVAWHSVRSRVLVKTMFHIYPSHQMHVPYISYSNTYYVYLPFKRIFHTSPSDLSSLPLLSRLNALTASSAAQRPAWFTHTLDHPCTTHTIDSMGETWINSKKPLDHVPMVQPWILSGHWLKINKSVSHSFREKYYLINSDHNNSSKSKVMATALSIDDILVKVKSKEFELHANNTPNSKSEVWKHFKKVIKVTDGTSVDSTYVICERCMRFSKEYIPTNGTSVLHKHLKKCLFKSSLQTSLTSFVSVQNVPSAVKKDVTSAAVALCVEDIRPFFSRQWVRL